jgi:hypothetical protein
MQKVINNLSSILISLLTLRIVVLGAPHIGEALALLSLAGIYGYKMYLDKLQVKQPTDELHKELELVKNEISKISVSNSQRGKSQPMTPYKF